jgi:hypothetical protein
MSRQGDSGVSRFGRGDRVALSITLAAVVLFAFMLMLRAPIYAQGDIEHGPCEGYSECDGMDPDACYMGQCRIDGGVCSCAYGPADDWPATRTPFPTATPHGGDGTVGFSDAPVEIIECRLEDAAGVADVITDCGTYEAIPTRLTLENAPAGDVISSTDIYTTQAISSHLYVGPQFESCDYGDFPAGTIGGSSDRFWLHAGVYYMSVEYGDYSGWSNGRVRLSQDSSGEADFRVRVDYWCDSDNDSMKVYLRSRYMGQYHICSGDGCSDWSTIYTMDGPGDFDFDRLDFDFRDYDSHLRSCGAEIYIDFIEVRGAEEITVTDVIQASVCDLELYCDFRYIGATEGITGVGVALVAEADFTPTHTIHDSSGWDWGYYYFPEYYTTEVWRNYEPISRLMTIGIGDYITDTVEEWDLIWQVNDGSGWRDPRDPTFGGGVTVDPPWIIDEFYEECIVVPPERFTTDIISDRVPSWLSPREFCLVGRSIEFTDDVAFMNVPAAALFVAVIFAMLYRVFWPGN